MEKKQIKNSGTIDRPSKRCKQETRYRCEYDDEPREIYLGGGFTPVEKY